MIKAFIFDLGGVVLTQKPEARLDTLAEVFKVSKNDLETILKKYNNDWSKGQISAKFLANRVKQKFKFNKSITEVLKIWGKAYQRRTTPNKELINLIDNLRKKYKIYLLTNTVDIHHNVNLNRNIYNHFDKVFASHEVGKRKPDFDFYEHALKEINLRADECIFVDDLKENVDAAKKLSFKTILFQNNKNFIRELDKIGIRI